MKNLSTLCALLEVVMFDIRISSWRLQCFASLFGSFASAMVLHFLFRIKYTMIVLLGQGEEIL